MFLDLSSLSCYGSLRVSRSHRNDPAVPPMNGRDPAGVANAFLRALLRGLFEPGVSDVPLPGGPALTLGGDWDKHFLPLRTVDVDNRIVRAVRSRMRRYQGVVFHRLDLRRLDIVRLVDAAEAADLPPIATFEITLDGEADGTIMLRQADRCIWGAGGGWRVWNLSP